MSCSAILFEQWILKIVYLVWSRALSLDYFTFQKKNICYNKKNHKLEIGGMEFAMDREKKGSIDTDPVVCRIGAELLLFPLRLSHARFTVIYRIWNEFFTIFKNTNYYTRKDTNSFVKCALILIRSEWTVYDFAYLENFPPYSYWTSEIFWRNVKKKFYRCLKYLYIIKRIIMYQFKWIIIFILKISYLKIYVNFYFIMNLNF